MKSKQEDEYNHNRSDEENLTERLVNLLRKSDKFRKLLIKRIYESVNEETKTKFPDFHQYEFNGENNILSECFEKNAEKKTVQFDVNMKGTDKNGKAFHILIENKVGDQIHLKQMNNYFSYLEREKGNRIIITITKTGTCYEPRSELNKLTHGHLYWNDIIGLLNRLKNTSTEENKLKNAVIEKLEELSCRFYDYPCGLEEFKSTIDKSKINIPEYRKKLKAISDPIFDSVNIFNELELPYLGISNKNTPSNTIAYEYIFRPKVKKKFPPWKRHITSICLWIGFGDIIYSLYKEELTFKQPSISISIWMPKQLPYDGWIKHTEEYNLCRQQLIAKYNFRESDDNLIITCIPLSDFVKNCKNEEDVFYCIKDKFEATIEKWNQNGVFDCLSEFWSKVKSEV